MAKNRVIYRYHIPSSSSILPSSLPFFFPSFYAPLIPFLFSFLLKKKKKEKKKRKKSHYSHFWRAHVSADDCLPVRPLPFLPCQSSQILTIFALPESWRCFLAPLWIIIKTLSDPNRRRIKHWGTQRSIVMLYLRRVTERWHTHDRQSSPYRFLSRCRPKLTASGWELCRPSPLTHG